MIIDFHCLGKKNFVKIFLNSKRKSVIWVWNNMRVRMVEFKFLGELFKLKIVILDFSPFGNGFNNGF